MRVVDVVGCIRQVLPAGVPFARESALIVAVRDGGDGGGGGGVGGSISIGGGDGGGDDGGGVMGRGSGDSGDGGDGDGDGDAACQLEAALFLQQLALFAPRAGAYTRPPLSST